MRMQEIVYGNAGEQTEWITRSLGCGTSYMKARNGDVTKSLRVAMRSAPSGAGKLQHYPNPPFLKILESIHIAPSRPSFADPV